MERGRAPHPPSSDRDPCRAREHDEVYSCNSKQGQLRGAGRAPAPLRTIEEDLKYERNVVDDDKVCEHVKRAEVRDGGPRAQESERRGRPEEPGILVRRR
jgi:hypothetical protein